MRTFPNIEVVIWSKLIGRVNQFMREESVALWSACSVCESNIFNVFVLIIEITLLLKQQDLRCQCILATSLGNNQELDALEEHYKQSLPLCIPIAIFYLKLRLLSNFVGVFFRNAPVGVRRPGGAFDGFENVSSRKFER
jgi:hypothetical protein